MLSCLHGLIFWFNTSDSRYSWGIPIRGLRWLRDVLCSYSPFYLLGFACFYHWWSSDLLSCLELSRTCLCSPLCRQFLVVKKSRRERCGPVCFLCMWMYVRSAWHIVVVLHQTHEATARRMHAHTNSRTCTSNESESGVANWIYHAMPSLLLPG